VSRADNKRRTRRAIAEAAMTLFARDGYEPTTVDAIAESAGVSRRTFFRYFPSKEDVVFPEHAARVARISALLTDGGSVRGALEELGRDLTRDKVRVVAQQRIIDASADLTAADRVRDLQLEGAVARALEEEFGVDEAVLRAGALMGGIRAVLRVWFAADGGFDLVERGGAVFDLLGWPAKR